VKIDASSPQSYCSGPGNTLVCAVAARHLWPARWPSGARAGTRSPPVHPFGRYEDLLCELAGRQIPVVANSRVWPAQPSGSGAARDADRRARGWRWRGEGGGSGGVGGGTGARNLDERLPESLCHACDAGRARELVVAPHLRHLAGTLDGRPCPPFAADNGVTAASSAGRVCARHPQRSSVPRRPSRRSAGR